MAENEPSSPRIFVPSSLNIDDSKLCFNKSHFSRDDFEVKKFMNLTRRRAGLEQIQKDLRLYLKSVQHSMIELINDDYADFVRLSSNLVGLQSSIDKIEKDLQNIWTEFENSTHDSVGTAEQIELRCDQLTYNRKRQTELRDKIAFLSALQKLQTLLKEPDSSILWLEKVASSVVDLTSYETTDSEDESKEKPIVKVLAKLEEILCKEGVKSASGDCFTLPLVLSILTLTKSSHVLTAALVADFLHPKLVVLKENHHELLESVLAGVLSVREEWNKVLGLRFSGDLKAFLDQTLLTFILTFLEKCLGMVIIPTDTKMFRKCFLTIEEFIRNWPSQSANRTLLKSIRDKFNFLVYFKLITYRLTKKMDKLSDFSAFTLEGKESRLKCTMSVAILEVIETIWSEEVFLFPLASKFWDFTLKLMSKHLSWSQHMLEMLRDEKKSIEGIPKWKCVLSIRSDLKSLHSAIFDLCLEEIWTKLRDMGVETSLFGQCLARFGQKIDGHCAELDKAFMEFTSIEIEQELDAASDIPKHYRWTRKPAATAPSPYIDAALDKIIALEKEFEDAEVTSNEMVAKIIERAISYLLDKLNKVLEGTEMHSSSRLLVSRKVPTAPTTGLTDNDKIKIQIFRDLEACSLFIDQRELEIEGLSVLLEKCRPDEQMLRGSSSPIPQNNSSSHLSENGEVNGNALKSEETELNRVSSQNSLREGSA